MAAHDFELPAEEPVFVRIDAATKDFTFALDEFVAEVNRFRHEHRLPLLNGIIAATEAELEAHAHLYEPLTSSSELLNIYGRQLFANHRALRGELTTMIRTRTWNEQRLAEYAEAE